MKFLTCSLSALVGSHLLIYGNERDNKPYSVQGIRGYSGRPAPNIVPRDQRRSEAAFEIFKPGNKTLQVREIELSLFLFVFSCFFFHLSEIYHY